MFNFQPFDSKITLSEEDINIYTLKVHEKISVSHTDIFTY